MDADGQVVDEADGHPGLAGGALGLGELGVGVPGEAAVEVDAGGEFGARGGRLPGARVGEGAGHSDQCGPWRSVRAAQVAWSVRAWPWAAVKSS